MLPQPDAVIYHGGNDSRRAAVCDGSGVVATIALVPRDWQTQDPATRYAPDGTVHLLGDGDHRVDVGWRYSNGQWSPPTSGQPTFEPTLVPDGDIAYGEVDAAGPPILVTLEKTGEQVEAGRLAGYTPEAKHMVKLTRISGQWVVEDRVLLATP